MKNILINIIALNFSIITAFSQITDPIPDTITKSGLSVEIEDVLQIPPSDNEQPLARINILKMSPDNLNRQFVNDLRGKLYVIIDNIPSVYLDLAAQHPNFIDSPGLGTGFGMFAFHPQFMINGKFYTSHGEATGSGSADFQPPVPGTPIHMQWVIMEWTAPNPLDNSFSGTSRELLRIDFPGNKHGIQDMAFNPNSLQEDPDYGMLYVCIGDGGTTDAGYPGNTQTLGSIFGTILRIDPLGTNGINGQYGIPADNPFTGTQPDTLPEIWAWGFRNPHRITWDSGGDGKMLIGEIGEKNIEEVDLGIAGANYGWNLREGTFLYDWTQNELVFPLPANDSTFSFTYPVAQYDHDEGFAIIGGFVYRGSAAAQLSGKYIFGDIKNGRVFYTEADSLIDGRQYEIHELTLTQNGEEIELSELVNDDRVDLRFGLDDNGEIYVLTKADGMVRKLIGVNVATAINRIPTGQPEGFALIQNYPNPFNPITTFRYGLPEDGLVNITIYDTMGRIVKNLVNRQENAGYKSIQWNSINNEGKQISAGLYFYTIETEKFSQTKKMILLK